MLRARVNATKQVPTAARLSLLLLAVASAWHPVQAQSPAGAGAAGARSVVGVQRVGSTGSVETEGSGFFVRADGVLATSYRTIEGASGLRVRLPEGRFAPADLVGLDPVHDLALLRVRNGRWPVLPLGSGPQPEIGAVLHIHATPVNGRGASSAVSLSGTFPENRIPYLVIRGSLPQGASGGPLVNDAGDVTGVLTLRRTGVAGLARATPVEYLRRLLAALGRPAPIPPPRAARYTEPPAGTAERTMWNLMVRMGEQAYGRAHLRLLTGPAAGSLHADENGSVTYTLIAGRDYSVIAVCDDGCAHPALDVSAPGGAALSETSSQEHVATVKIRPRRAGDYRLVIRMRSCRSDRCAYAIGLLGR